MAQSATYYETFNKYQVFMNTSKICITVFSLKDKLLPQFTTSFAANLRWLLSEERKPSWKKWQKQMAIQHLIIFSKHLQPVQTQDLFILFFLTSSWAKMILWKQGSCMTDLQSLFFFFNLLSFYWAYHEGRTSIFQKKPSVNTNSKIPSSYSLIQSLHIKITVIYFQESVCMKCI